MDTSVIVSLAEEHRAQQNIIQLSICERYKNLITSVVFAVVAVVVVIFAAMAYLQSAMVREGRFLASSE